MRNYELAKIRIALIYLLEKTLNKNSKFYNEDYENIVKAVNKKTRRELIEAYNRQLAINSVSEQEAQKHCII